MRIGILGASFSPPHLGHAEIVKNTLDTKTFDQVWLMPAHVHPFLKNLETSEHRLTMVQLLHDELRQQGYNVLLEKYELDKEDPSYSYTTLTHFAALRPADTFAFIIGSDNIEHFNRWYHYQELLAKFEVYVYPRPNYPMTGLLPGMKPLTGMPEVSVSSSEVRAAIVAGKPVEGLVGEKLAAYLSQHRLYSASSVG